MTDDEFFDSLTDKRFTNPVDKLREAVLKKHLIPPTKYGLSGGISGDAVIWRMKEEYENLLEEKGKLHYALLNAFELLATTPVGKFYEINKKNWGEKIEFINNWQNVRKLK